MKWRELTERERDALVAERVMGYRRLTVDEYVRERNAQGWVPALYSHVTHVWLDSDDKKAAVSVNEHGEVLPHFCRLMVDAWQVVERMTSAGRFVSVANDPADGTWNCVVTDDTGESWEVDTPTAPEAICLAALWACGVEVEP